jgi:hypothetical protein
MHYFSSRAFSYIHSIISIVEGGNLESWHNWCLYCNLSPDGALRKLLVSKVRVAQGNLGREPPALEIFSSDSSRAFSFFILLWQAET